MKIWINQQELPQLISHYRDDGTLLISDTRYEPLKEREYGVEEAMVYRSISDPASLSKVKSSLSEENDPASCSVSSEEDILDCLQSFVDDGLAIEENNTYLGLALPEGTIDPPYSIRCLIPMPN